MTNPNQATCYRSQRVAARSYLTQDMSEYVSSGDVELDNGPICGGTRAAQIDDNLLSDHGLFIRPSPVIIRLSKYNTGIEKVETWRETVSAELSDDYEQMEVDRLMEATAKGGTYSGAGVTSWRSETCQQAAVVKTPTSSGRRNIVVNAGAKDVVAPKVETKAVCIVISSRVVRDFCREIEDRGAKFWAGYPKDWDQFVDWAHQFKGGQFVGRLPEIRKTLERRTLDRMTG